MPPWDTRDKLVQMVLTATAYFVHVIGIAAILYANPSYWQQDYHTSALSGAAWVNKLIHGHPDRIYNELGMCCHVFLAFVANLKLYGGLEVSKKGITVEEQAAIFLYTCVTGLSIHHIGERFQHSNETISKYFRRVLDVVSSGPFYNAFVKLPGAEEPVLDVIHTNPKLFPFFEDALSAIDGTHINCSVSTEDRHASRDCKGGITQNCLAACSFYFRFLYVITGFEGSIADATMYMHSHLIDFAIPNGRYYLADAGFALCNTLLVPYRNIWYHLAEWGRANICPVNKEELFNLRHAQSRNVIEHIFGVLKKRWNILNYAPHYNMEIQAQIPPGLAAVHNFIMDYNKTDIYNYLDDEIIDYPDEEQGQLGNGAIQAEERQEASALWDKIATKMWQSYQTFLQNHPEMFDEDFNPETY